MARQDLSLRVLAGDPSAALGAATKQFVAAGTVPSATGKIAGAPLTNDGSGAAVWGNALGPMQAGAGNLFYPDTVAQGGASLTSTFIAVGILLVPFSRPMTISKIGFQVTTGVAASTARLGLYASNADGSPGALIEEATSATQINCATTGVKIANFASSHVVRDRVWLALQGSSNSIAIRIGSPGVLAPSIGGNSSGATELGTGNQTNLLCVRGYAAFPSTLGTLSGDSTSPIIIAG